MSLKAKIEAVIYASEEPVTLAQLAGLLGQEAQAELDHLESAQQSLALAETDASGEAQASADAEGTAPPLTEPEPTDTAPSGEPEPTDSSPIREHPAPTVEPTEAAAEKSVRDQKLDEKLRERKLRDYFRSILDELIADYARESNDRGLEIREVASGFRLSTKPQYHDTVRGFVKSLKPPLKLSLQALETLAVVAYKQPVTAPEVSEIRGVDSGGVLGSLMARKLVTTAGRKQVIGRPILYKTTRDFLLRFGLKDINELPSIEEFEKMAGELADGYAEPVQEEIPMPEHPAPEGSESGDPDRVEQEKNAVSPQADGDSDPIDDPIEDPIDAPPSPHAVPATESPAVESSADAYTPAASDEQAIGAADEVLIDGRLSGLPPNYDTETTPEGADSPALDAEIQREDR
jgi:segregation and condensation protein B